MEGGGETNAWTWRKGSCSFVEDIILRGWAGLSQPPLCRLDLCTAKGRCWRTAWCSARKRVGDGRVAQAVWPMYAAPCREWFPRPVVPAESRRG